MVDAGLDSFAAQAVCKKLVELGKTQGCNILCTIHQPASEVFHTFSKTMILYKGRDLFFGAIRAFSAGIAANHQACPSEYNLADHAISLTQTLSVDELDQLRTALIAGKFGDGAEAHAIAKAHAIEQVEGLLEAEDPIDALIECLRGISADGHEQWSV